MWNSFRIIPPQVGSTLSVSQKYEDSSIILVFTIEHWGSHFQHVYSAIYHICFFFLEFPKLISSAPAVNLATRELYSSYPLSHFPPFFSHKGQIKTLLFLYIVGRHWEEKTKDVRSWNSVNKLSDSRGRQAYVQTHLELHSSCVILGNETNLSESQLSNLQNALPIKAIRRV